ncbi:LysR substrate-binding domain-containing protein [Rosenbergiella collisarenosi]|uniref:LysR substrate-binding domain-containing protein n=1 Tax=Rosenbergiella collisarenosi TaxID=1544695 RepID=UPI001BD93E76|nr:LysR substrate-binding domain-containing protein [Rosenbergiella collisarenosi]MBT0720521.1 transcriptional regulator LrhA [Rosenbergiella collisarenosi]
MTIHNNISINLDLDLLRTFVAVADLNTFAAAASAVCRTQSAVSQQMQRLEQIVDRELFARHGRNKLLTEHGIQLLGYARKILRFNDEACASLQYSNDQEKLIIGATEDTSESLLPFMLNRITALYPSLDIEIRVNRTEAILALLAQQEIDIALTTQGDPRFEQQILRTSPTLWFCAADFAITVGEAIPLVIQNEGELFRELAINALDAHQVPWRFAYVANSKAAINVAVKAGLGATARPAEMLNPELRVLGAAEGLPSLPDTQYLLCRQPQGEKAFVRSLFNVLAPIPDSVQRVISMALPDQDVYELEEG